MSVPGTSFGERLRLRRKALDLTQEALGERVSCSPHTIRKIEADERHPSRRLAARLVEALGIAPAEQSHFVAAARGLNGNARAPGLSGEGWAAASTAAGSPGMADSAGPLADAPAAEATLPAGSAPPFVGREHELRCLRAWLARLPTHHGRVVLVSGEAGIGKTRLMHELAAHALRAGLPVVGSKCHEIERDVAYRALVDLIEQAVALAPAGFEQRLDAVARAELTVLVPALAARWVALPALSAELPQARQMRLFGAVLGLFQVLAEPDGLMLVLDDLQWLDDASALALLHLAQHTPQTRVLLLLACRSEDLNADERLRRLVAGLQDSGPLERLLLPGLTRAEAAELLQAPRQGHTLHPAAADTAWLDAWHAGCRGNPLFLVAALGKGRSAEGTLRGAAEAGGSLQATPESVRQLVRGRLERLSAPARRLLDALAVIGHSADFELMLGVAEGDAADPSWLDAVEHLVQRQWLREDEASDGYDVAHDRLREALLAEMGTARRAALHARVARHLRGGAWVPHALVAEHEEQAHHWEAAVRHRLQAGMQAEALFAVQEAIGHYTRGLALTTRHPEALPAQLESDLLERRGLAHAWLSQADQAAADLQPAVTRALARLQAGRAVELLTALGMCYQRADRYAAGADALHQALRLARELGEAKAAAVAMWWLGDIDWGLDDNAAASVWFEQVMALCDSAALDDDARVKAHHGLGEVAVLDARPADALAHFWRSLALAQRLGDTRMVCENLIVIAWAHLGFAGTGRYQAAIDHCDQVSAMVEHADMPWYQPPALICKGTALAAQGRFGAALACFQPALAAARALGMARFEAMALTWLAECCLDAAQPALALSHAAKARGVMDDTGVAFFSHHLRAVHAQALIRLGRASEVSDLHVALAVARSRLLGHAMLRTLDTLTEWHQARGDLAAAQACAREWAALARARGVPEMRVRALAWLLRLRFEAGAREGRHAGVLGRVERLLAACRPGSRFSLRLELHRLRQRSAQALPSAESAAAHDAALAELELTLAEAAPALGRFIAV